MTTPPNLPPDLPSQGAGDDARDAHLLAALRHAPDRAVAPPAGVSARILADARKAVQPAVQARPAEGSAKKASPDGTWTTRTWTTRLRERLRTLDRWLLQPATAGAVATVALATVIGLMWREGPLPDEAARIAAMRPDPSAQVPAAPELQKAPADAKATAKVDAPAMAPVAPPPAAAAEDRRAGGADTATTASAGKA